MVKVRHSRMLLAGIQLNNSKSPSFPHAFGGHPVKQ
ncbi:MAG: hypothetical protein ACI9MF_001259 [Gammaproteobacteria bacterium]